MNSGDITVVIPVRAGSKGFPDKNVADFAGSTLLRKTVEDACSVFRPQDVVVSSDSVTYLNSVGDTGVVLHHRSNASSADGSSTEDVITELNDAGMIADYVLILQVTSPLRSVSDIEDAVKAYPGVGTLFSVVKTPLHHWMLREGVVTPIGSSADVRQPRQQSPEVLSENGALYLFSTHEFKSSRNRFNAPFTPFVMPYESSIDIDSNRDLQIAELLRGLL